VCSISQLTSNQIDTVRACGSRCTKALRIWVLASGSFDDLRHLPYRSRWNKVCTRKHEGQSAGDVALWRRTVPNLNWWRDLEHGTCRKTRGCRLKEGKRVDSDPKIVLSIQNLRVDSYGKKGGCYSNHAIDCPLESVGAAHGGQTPFRKTADCLVISASFNNMPRMVQLLRRHMPRHLLSRPERGIVISRKKHVALPQIW